MNEAKLAEADSTSQGCSHCQHQCQQSGLQSSTAAQHSSIQDCHCLRCDRHRLLNSLQAQAQATGMHTGLWYWRHIKQLHEPSACMAFTLACNDWK